MSGRDVREVLILRLPGTFGTVTQTVTRQGGADPENGL
jgi:hypothetical protein